MIDAQTVRSPGWYLKQLFDRLSGRQRQYDLQLLFNYLDGKPPLPQGAENARAAYEAFMRMACSNFADLVTSALANRMRPVGFDTVREADATGDREIGALWHRAGLPVIAGDVHRTMLALRESYAVVGEVDPETDAAIVTVEDPRYMVGMPDPIRPNRLRSALKVRYDEDDGVDRAYVYLPGTVTGGRAQIWVAKRKAWGQLGPLAGFNPREWDWDPDHSGELLHDRIPVVRFNNLADRGEYEPHLPLLDRINHQILQRMTIAVMQAFRQRWVSGLDTHYPDDYEVEELRGQPIDYSSVFVADPAAIWQLPQDAKVGEAGAVELRPLIEAIQADVQHLAFVTSTPLHMLDSGGDNQSAEGATLAREGLLFKARDRISRVQPRWSQVVGLMLMQAGETDIRLISSLQSKFAPPELLSMAERADAASKAANDVPRRSRLLDIWGFEPEVVDRMMTEWTEEQLLAQQLAQVTAAAQPLAIPSRQQFGAGGEQGHAPQDGGQQPQLAVVA